MPLLTARTSKFSYNSELFLLNITCKELTTNIDIKLHVPIFTTKSLINTHLLLKNDLPSILRSKCFNPNNYSFKKEVRNTEIGHLFEHILLEYLCVQKILSGVDNPVYNGLTEWDWEKEEKGVFHIKIDIGIKDLPMVKVAVLKSIRLLEKIMLSFEGFAYDKFFADRGKLSALQDEDYMV